MDKLKEIYELQKELCIKIGVPQVGIELREEGILASDETKKIAGEWIIKMLACINSEVEELRDCIYWKHWSNEISEGKYNMLHDVQNARVEAIDLLHFVLNLCVLLGMDVEDIHRMYVRKNEINIVRQETGYSTSNKTEEDNKSVL